MLASRMFVVGPLLLQLVAGAAGCSGVAEVPAGPGAAPSSVQSSSDDTVIGSDQMGQTVTIKVGEVIRVVRPSDAQWRLDYAFDILTMLTPEEKRANPGPEGWRLKGLAEGETALTLVMVVQSGNPMTVGYTIRVVKP